MPTHEILVDSERMFHAISAAYNKNNDDPSQTGGVQDFIPTTSIYQPEFIRVRNPLIHEYPWFFFRVIYIKLV